MDLTTTQRLGLNPMHRAKKILRATGVVIIFLTPIGWIGLVYIVVYDERKKRENSKATREGHIATREQKAEYERFP